MLFMARGDETYIWFTLKPETTELTPRTITELKRVLAAVELHAEAFWNLDLE